MDKLMDMEVISAILLFSITSFIYFDMKFNEMKDHKFNAIKNKPYQVRKG